MEPLAARFGAVLRSLPVEPEERAVVAVSGGPDSLALLHLLLATRPAHRLDLLVAHVDHGIHPASGAVAAGVAALAAARGLPFEARRLELGAAAGETTAREHRYTALEAIRLASGARWVITAHHADDQAETVLLRLLHGSGPAGLAAMAPVREPLLRPLLGFRRTELAAYLAGHEGEVWFDPANADVAHERAWLRQIVLPLLHDRLPDVTSRLLRAGRLAAEDRAGWDAVLDALPALDVRSEPDGISVAAPTLAGYDSPLGMAVARAAARRVGVVVGERGGARLLDLARRGASGASAPLGGTAFAELAFGRLRIVRSAAAAPGPRAVVPVGPEPAELRWGRWIFRWRREPAPAAAPRNGLTAWFVTKTELQIRPWLPGDRIRPLGGAGSRLVVRCLQEARVPRSRRGGWAVVEAAGQVVWVPGVCRAEELVPERGSEALRVDAAYA